MLVVGTAVSGLLVVSGPATAGITSEQAKASQLQQQIVQQGTAVQQLVARADAAQAHLQALDAEVAAMATKVAADRRAQSAATVHLRQVAVTAYMGGNQASSTLAMFATGGAENAVARQEYTTLATSGLRDAIDAERAAAHRTQMAETTLHGAQRQAQVTVTRLASERQQAQGALQQDDALLTQVNGTIAQLTAQAALQQLAARRAQEEAALAAQQAQQAQIALQEQQAQRVQAIQVVAPAGSPTVQPAPGTYADPLRAITDLSPERVDQGVDYSGFGPLYAIGSGVVLNTVNAGWPGGTFITYRLTSGPAAGLVVYAAEDIQPAVQVGQHVTSSTVIGTMYEGPDGIETGWASSSGNGETMARSYGQFSGANSTAFGANFSQLLASIGAPAGIMQNNPPTGSLPPNWPAW